MTALIFHGGHYKTGTTSLQHVLRASEAGLAATGVLYPRGLPDAQFSDVQHADLVTDCFAGKFDRVEAYLAQIAAEAQARNCGTVLLSSELSTSFHRFPGAFERWLEIAARHFETPRYVFVVRDVLGYARSMYRELVKSGRASFHFDVVKDELARLLCEQQSSIAFFRRWDSSRVTLLGFKALAEDRLVERLIKQMVGYDVDAMISMVLNSSAKKAQNIAALLLNDVYALMGASLGLDPLSNQVRAAVKEKVKRGRLKRAFDDDFAAEVEQAFLDVTDRHVRRVLAAERAAIEASLAALPADVAGWLTDGLPDGPATQPS
jgi:hypothetical protein